MSSIQEDLTGRVAIVTGATGGIGKEVAREFARLGATVVVGARDVRRGELAVAELRKNARYPDNISAMTIDVANMASVRTFAAAIEERFAAVHILVNNAGAWFTDRQETSEGHERTFATNALGPYLLTRLLTPRLRAAKGAHVVNVVSDAVGDYEAGDLEWKRRPFNSLKAYNQAKQALRMITWTQAEQLEKDQILVNAVAPGFVKTEFNTNVKGFLPAVFRFLGRFMAVTPAKGADTVVWAAASTEVAGRTSKLFVGRKEKDGKFREANARATLDGLCQSMSR